MSSAQFDNLDVESMLHTLLQLCHSHEDVNESIQIFSMIICTLTLFKYPPTSCM
jgi:hypothetical protein